MNHNRNVCIVHAYPSRDLLDMFRGSGYSVLLIAPSTFSVETHEAMKACERVDVSDIHAVLDACFALHQKYRIDAVLSLNETTVIHSAEVAKALSLPGNSVESAASSRNKYAAYLCYVAGAVDTPKTIVLHTPWEDYERACESLGTPFVVKLTDSMNSQGVVKVESRQDYATAMYMLNSLLNEAKGTASEDNRNRLAYGVARESIIAQEYCEGDEFNVDVLYKDGVYVPLLTFQKAKMDRNYFGEKASFYPPLVNKEVITLVENAASRAVSALGASVGSAHVEVKYVHGRGPVVIEAGLRPGGGFTTQAASIYYGINFYKEIADLMMGGEVKNYELKDKDRAVLYGGKLFDKSGRFEELIGTELLDQTAEIRKYVVLAKRGDKVRALPKSAQPHSVYYVLEGNNIDKLLQIHEDLQERLIPKVSNYDDYIAQTEELNNGISEVMKALCEDYARPTRHKAFNEFQLNFESERLPEGSTPLTEVIENLVQDMYAGYSNFLSPFYFAHYAPRPSPASIIGNLIAHAYNQAPGAWRGGAMSVKKEIEALHWLRELTRYTSNCESNEPCGVFTSGGTMANATAIKLARDQALGVEIMKDGLGRDGRKCVIYASDNSHFSIDRAADFMGFGSDSIFKIPLNDANQMDPAFLERAIKEHLATGAVPVCVVATIGSTGCSDYDDIASIANVAARYGVWLHVDAAATAPYATLEELTSVFHGMDRADSVTVDPYKMMYLSFGIGALLVKEPKRLVASFDTNPSYFHDDQRLNSFKLSFRGTAPWASLSLWMTLKTYGVAQLKSHFRSSIECVRYLSARLREINEIEIYREPVFPVLCFRVKVSSNPIENDVHNIRLVELLCHDGEIYVTGSTTNRGEFIRLSVDNYLVDDTVMDRFMVNLVLANDKLKEGRAT